MELWQEIILLSCLSLVGGAIGGATVIALAAQSEIRRKIKRDQRIMTIMGASDTDEKQERVNTN